MNLWTNIHDRITTTAAPRPRTLLALNRAVAVLAIILFAGSVYAIYQVVSRSGDPGVQAVSELITDIGQTMEWSPEDLDVTLDWGYADGHRIVLGWSMEFPIDLNVPVPTITMLDREGNEFPDAAFLYGGGGGGGGGGDRIKVSSTNSFDATTVAGEPAVLPLTVHFTFGEAPGTSGSGGAGGGGGGSGRGEPMPPRRELQQPVRLMFDFELPFIPAQAIDGAFTAESNGLAMSLTDVSYAPSVTLATLCYEQPDGGEPHYPHFPPTADGSPIAAFARDTAETVDGQVCGRVTSFVPADGETGLVSLTIDRLQSDPTVTGETVARLQALVDESGLGMAVSPLYPPNGDIAFMVDTLEPSDDPAGDAARFERLEAEAMRQVVDGPWTFEIDVR